MWDEQYEKLIRQYLPFLPADEPLDPDTDLRDFGLDSLGIVDVLSALEQTFQIRFTEDLLTAETFRTPKVLWTAVSGLMDAARS
ncbi:acyl carrier protein [Kutzneria sp. CA-103260]|uniref:acyl carrier protein n=1 Tax=Kutzneria sp. CA-103260 TaxID=2802641 RepID=UPI001BA62A34|nr:acyl carrier protein [Kutzneria sp. CA-103260]QUQ65435.1 phosphopantetheine-binding protein [Kutzneria sp. CA-103260]